jgi:desulfoferrodoxin (superoxide reductase-like protein)
MTKTSGAIALSLVIGLATGCKDQEKPGNDPIVPMKEYTLDNAREWTDIAKFHAPTAKKSFANGKDAVIVEVPLPDADFPHYIEKIGIMDIAGKELAAETLERGKGRPRTYAYFDKSILPWSGRVKVFAKCNKHDLWVTEISVKDLGV